nr:SJCHGC02585 protein [Schistosoma japonicum]
MTCVAKFYDDVIEDVISGVKDEFVEDGGDVQILEELKKVSRIYPLIHYNVALEVQAR